MLDIGTHTDDPNSNFDESNPDLKQLAILETIYEIFKKLWGNYGNLYI